MQCKICSSDIHQAFEATVIRKHKIKFYKCHNCGFLQTEEPFWLNEVYADPISRFDTGVIARNISISKYLSSLLFGLYRGKGTFVDFAGGYGLLTRMMRDQGYDFYWSDKYTENIFAKGFEYETVQQQLKPKALVAIECIEHLPDPMRVILDMLTVSETIIFTTELLPNPIPNPEEWWYYCLDRGGHIAFFEQRTFEYLAEKHNLYFYQVGIFKLLTTKAIGQKKLKLLKAFLRFRLDKVIPGNFLQSRTNLDYDIMIKQFRD